ncbi:MAG TPA: hypothetical protein ENG59_05965 [Chloroflexi bacterium]|nr:MAG: hypothetical protein DRI46_00225 [Chloroflexota bacterium]HDD55769.1 hypothetical protein [Chloroflexota bacterium]
MTAINPARLKIQTAELGELVGQAEIFVPRLHEMLFFYSARVRQTDLSTTLLTLRTYQVPEPVIQALEREIAERLEGDAEVGYSLADALWRERWVEFRRLAVHVLGILPTEEPNRILRKIRDWLEKCNSEGIRRMILTEGMARLASEKPDQSIHFLEELINSGSKESHQAALFGLESFAKNPSYANLPVLFGLLSQILLREEIGLVKEISALLLALASRSEQEVTFFLIKQLVPASKPRIYRVIRQVMRQLSPENQHLLHEKMESQIKLKTEN